MDLKPLSATVVDARYPTSKGVLIMSRSATAFAVILVAPALVLGLADCSSSHNSSAAGSTSSGTTGAATTSASSASSAPSATDSSAATSSAAASSAPAPGGGGSACGDEKYIVGVIRGLQQGQQPGDQAEVAKRANDFVQEAPAEIQQPAQGVTGPLVVSVRHPEVAGGELGTDGVKSDLDQLDAWSRQNC
ncbi:hypothetical protein ABH920_009795 [Catenulispora sp. EB89]|uniref:hypothetical protein n=1 Tax=Catenulispora sp. EB89 TaxID=3156257 RepID=UPI003517D20A